MSQHELERARAFLARADADLAAVRTLEKLDTVPDEIVGFHGQQACEKLLKAVLATHGIHFPRTHSIRFLLDLLADHGERSSAAATRCRSASARSKASNPTTSSSTWRATVPSSSATR